MLAVVAGLVGLAAPASAVTWISNQQMCNTRTDFAAFIRNNDRADKYCYNNAGPSTINLGLDRATYFYSGNNSGYFYFIDGADGRRKPYHFGKYQETGCHFCYIEEFHLDQ